MKLICYHATENIFELFLSMCYLAVIIVNCIFIHILFFFFLTGLHSCLQGGRLCWSVGGTQVQSTNHVIIKHLKPAWSNVNTERDENWCCSTNLTWSMQVPNSICLKFRCVITMPKSPIHQLSAAKWHTMAESVQGFSHEENWLTTQWRGINPGFRTNAREEIHEHTTQAHTVIKCQTWNTNGLKKTKQNWIK